MWVLIIVVMVLSNGQVVSSKAAEHPDRYAEARDCWVAAPDALATIRASLNEASRGRFVEGRDFGIVSMCLDSAAAQGERS